MRSGYCHCFQSMHRQSALSLKYKHNFSVYTFPMRLRILPKGVVSKKDIGARKIACINGSCRFLLAATPPIKREETPKKLKITEINFIYITGLLKENTYFLQNLFLHIRLDALRLFRDGVRLRFRQTYKNNELLTNFWAAKYFTNPTAIYFLQSKQECLQ